MFLDLQEKLNFIELLDKFKYVKRIIHHPEDLSVQENDAEHSWHLAMMVLVLHDEFPQLNLKKCLTFAIIHDLPELYAGDTAILDVEKEKTKYEREQNAIKKILSQLDGVNKKKFENLFQEYENKKSAEARFVYELDKIQPMLLNVLAKGFSWKKNKIPKDKLRERKLATVSDEFGLREILNHYHKIAEQEHMYYEE